MNGSFTKLFSSITDSTIWSESHATRIVWVTMLSMSDQRGCVGASVPGLAHRARVTLEEAEHALARFLAPDQYSRTPDNDGRRIAVVDGGWQLLNYAKYREARDDDARREYQREWDRVKRVRPTDPTISDNIRHDPTTSDRVRPSPTKAEAEVDIKKLHIPVAKPATVDWFPAFWDAYPRKSNKARAQVVWAKLKPDQALTDRILSAAAAQAKSADWQREDGRYIPHAATWLNGKQWEDTPTVIAPRERKVSI